MNEHETTADIITWLRRPREGENAYLTLWRDEIADRLEAAHKRELSKNASKNGADFGQLGDAAKLRKALRKIKELFRDVDLTIDRPENEAYTIADAALAAPPRNCDLYKTKEQAQDAFLQGVCDHPCGNCWVKDINNECGVDWLLAPATKGGNDADK